MDPRDKLALCSLGAIAWYKASPAVQSARTRSGMGSDEPGPIEEWPDPRRRADEVPGARESRHRKFEKALEVDKDYADAMAYLSLN